MQAEAVPGVQYAYLLLPRMDDLGGRHSYPPYLEVDGQAVPIIDLGRPDLYPQLYQPGNWYDDSHLSEAGAALASTLIAQQLDSFAAQHPFPVCGG